MKQETDREILIWVHQRLVKVHGESKFKDYMHALRDVIYGLPNDKRSRGEFVNGNSTEVLHEIEEREALTKAIQKGGT